MPLVTPRRLAALQEGILDDIKRRHPGTTDAAISAAAGVDRTQVSKWRSGEREMRLGELAGLLVPFGASAALGPIAALDEAEVVERGNPAPADPRVVALEVNIASSELARAVHLALSDQRIDPDEIAAIAQRVEDLVADLRRLQAGTRHAS